jgi:hypothetical protein
VFSYPLVIIANIPIFWQYFEKIGSFCELYPNDRAICQNVRQGIGVPLQRELQIIIAMRKFFKVMTAVLAVLGCTSVANAQEPQKEGFMKRAFRDMKESAKLQHQIDKANFQATKLETKAFYEEQKRLSNPSVRTAAEKQRMQKELEAANKRVADAQAKLDATKQ